MPMSAELKGCVTWIILVLDFLYVRYDCAEFHHCRICVTNFREGGGPFCSPPHQWPVPKKPFLNRVNNLTDLTRWSQMTFFILLLLYTIGLIRKAMRNKVKKQWWCRLLEFHNIKFCHPYGFAVGDMNMYLISSFVIRAKNCSG